MLAPVGRRQVHASISASSPLLPCLLEVRDDEWDQGVIGRGRCQVTGVNVELTEMVEINNGSTFQYYFAKARSFDGIFLNTGSFNGMDLIFPFLDVFRIKI